MRNRPEYMETLAACFRARLTHVNVNYRYVADEVHYIFDNSDAAVVVYGKEFRDNVEILRPRLPNVKLWIEVGDGADCPPTHMITSIWQPPERRKSGRWARGRRFAVFVYGRHNRHAQGRYVGA